MAATEQPLAMSPKMLVRLRPRWSTSAPPSRAPTTVGSMPAKAVRPVRPALPVVSRTNQGMASPVTALPTSETALPASMA